MKIPPRVEYRLTSTKETRPKRICLQRDEGAPMMSNREILPVIFLTNLSAFEYIWEFSYIFSICCEAS